MRSARISKALRRLPRLIALEDRLAPAVITWVGRNVGTFPDGDQWEVAANWDMKVVPGSTDTAKFGGVAMGSATCKLNSTTTINSLVFTAGPYLEIHGSLTVTGESSWTVFPTQSSRINVIGPSGELINETTGKFTFDSKQQALLGGGGKFINKGTLIQKGSQGIGIDGNSVVLNQGVHDIQTEGYGLGGNAGTYVNQGVLQRTAGTGLTRLTCNLDLSGSINVESGTLSLYPNLVGSKLNSVTVHAGVGATLNLSESTVDFSGVVNGSGDGAVIVTNTINLQSDTTFNFSSPQTFQWKSGAINLNGHTLTNAVGSTLTCSSYSATGSGQLLGQGTLKNEGTFAITVGGLSIGTASTVFETVKGGVLDLQTNYYVSGPGSLISAGTLRRSGTTSTVQVISNYTLGGDIDVQSGTLKLYPTSAKGTLAGAAINVSPGATFLFNGIQSITGSVSASGGGLISQNSPGITLAGDTTVSFAGPMFQWLTGTLDLAGHTLTNAIGGTITILGNGSLTGGSTLVNQGTIVHSSPYNLGFTLAGATTSLVNAPTGLYDIQGYNGPVWTGSAATTGTFKNQGQLRRSTGNFTAYLSANFENDGGTIDVQIGSLDLPGTVALNKGTLQGRGTLVAPVTNADGIVRPGNSPGQLTITGDYAQNGTGTLAVELNGLNAGPDFDQLTVNGNVTLGGSLVPSINYSAKAGETLVIIVNNGSKAVTGTFSGLPEGGTISIGDGSAQITYKGGNGNDVALKIITPPTSSVPAHVSFVKINDGSAQRSRVTSLMVALSQSVTLPANSADAFQLKRQSDGALVTLKASTADNIVTLTFVGGPTDVNSLADGRYTLTIFASKVSNFDGNNDGTAGDDYVLAGTPSNGLFRLFGDNDGDGDVDTTDFGAFRAAFGGSNNVFDFDNDGDVDTSDFGQFRARFGAAI